MVVAALIGGVAGALLALALMIGVASSTDLLRGPQGPVGEMGPAGPMGFMGPPGETPQADFWGCYPGQRHQDVYVADFMPVDGQPPAMWREITVCTDW